MKHEASKLGATCDAAWMSMAECIDPELGNGNLLRVKETCHMTIQAALPSIPISTHDNMLASAALTALVLNLLCT